MSEGSYRLGNVLSAWFALLGNGDSHELASMLAVNVVWHGVMPGQICHNRREVLALLGRHASRPLRLTRIEAEEFGERVAVTVGSPDFPDLEGQPTKSRALVFTFEGDAIVSMDAFGSRDAAFEFAAQ